MTAQGDEEQGGAQGAEEARQPEIEEVRRVRSVETRFEGPAGTRMEGARKPLSSESSRSRASSVVAKAHFQEEVSKIRSLSDSLFRSWGVTEALLITLGDFDNPYGYPERSKRRKVTFPGASSLGLSSRRSALLGLEQQELLEAALESHRGKAARASAAQTSGISRRFFKGMLLRGCLRPSDQLDQVLAEAQVLDLRFISPTAARILHVALLLMLAGCIACSTSGLAWFLEVKGATITKLLFSSSCSPELPGTLSLQGTFCPAALALARDSQADLGLESPVLLESQGDGKWIARFQDDSAILGWSWSVPSSHQAPTSCSFAVEAWDGRKWIGFGVSSLHYAPHIFTGVLALAQSCPATTAGCKVVFDELGWPWISAFLAPWVLLASAALLSLVCLVLKGGKGLLRVLHSALWLFGLLRFVSFLAFAVEGQVMESLVMFVQGLCSIRISRAWGHSFDWRQLAKRCFGSVALAAIAVILLRTLNRNVEGLLETTEVYALVLVLGIWALHAVVQFRHVRAVNRRMVKHREELQEIWEQCVAREGPSFQETMRKLSFLCQQQPHKDGSQPARQCYSPLADLSASAGSGVFNWPFLGTANSAHQQVEVSSIEQLYLGAATIYPYQLEKVKGLAYASNGCFKRAQRRISLVNSHASFSVIAQTVSSPTPSASTPTPPSTVGGRTAGTQAECRAEAWLVPPEVDQVTEIQSVIEGDTLHLGGTTTPEDIWLDSGSSNRIVSLNTPSEGEFTPSRAQSSEEGDAEYVKWRDIGDGHVLASTVAFSPIKKFERSLLKVSTVYHGKVWRLVDLVRQEILFESIADLTLCLEQILRDDSIVIERIVNKFSVEHLRELEGGYRFVKINFRIVNAETKTLAVDLHCCELLLSLVDLHRRKDQVPGQLYHEFRLGRHHRQAKAAGSWTALFECLTSQVRRRHSSQTHAESGRDKTLSINDLSLRFGGSEGPEDNSDDAKLFELAVNHHVASVRTPAGRLDSESRRAWMAFENSETGSVFLMQNPAYGILVKWKTVCVLVFLGCVSSLVELVQIPAMNSRFEQKSARFRFTLLETRGGSEAPQNVSIAEFGLRHNGCNLPCVGSCLVKSNSNSTVEITYPVEQTFNGWYFVTHPFNAPDSDPVRFLVEKYQGQRFVKFGTSSSYQIQTDAFVHDEGSQASVPVTRGEPVVFYLGPAPRFVVGWLAGAVCVVLPIPYIVWAFHARNLPECIWGTEVLLTLIGFIPVLPHLIALPFMNERRLLVLLEMRRFCWVVMALTLRFKMDRYILDAFMLCNLAPLVSQLVMDRLTGERDSSVYTFAATVCAALAAKVLQLRVQSKSRAFAKTITANYDKAWHGVLESTENLRDLARLEDLTEQIQPSRVGTVKQRSLYWHSLNETQGFFNPGVWKEFMLHSGDRLWDVCPEIVSLDQLLCQAQVLRVLLEEKVDQWREGSGASVSPNTEHNNCGFRNVHVKNVKRILQKLYRCYAQDKSRLLDVCRTTVIYETVPDLINGLSNISTDTEIKILRIKNTICPGKKSTSLGYRQVILNFQLRTPSAEEYGVSMHIAEVQLCLKALHQIQAALGHQTYKTWRDLRGA